MPSKSGVSSNPNVILLNLFNIRSKLAWTASTLGVVTLGFSMFALFATVKGDEKFEKEVRQVTLFSVWQFYQHFQVVTPFREYLRRTTGS